MRPDRASEVRSQGCCRTCSMEHDLLIGSLRAGVPPAPPKKLSEMDPVKFDDRMIQFHGQA